MPGPIFTSFASLSGAGEIDEPAQLLDQNFQLVNSVCQCVVSGGPNAITLTAAANQPPIPNPPTDKQRFGFIATANSTGTVTVTVNGVIYATSGVTLLNGSYYDLVFVQAMFSGAGGFQNAAANAPTQPTGNNSTLIANTAFVQNSLPGTTHGSVGSYLIVDMNISFGGSVGNPVRWSDAAPAIGSTSTTNFAGTWRNMGICWTQSIGCPAPVTTTTNLALRVA